MQVTPFFLSLKTKGTQIFHCCILLCHSSFPKDCTTEVKSVKSKLPLGPQLPFKLDICQVHRILTVLLWMMKLFLHPLIHSISVGDAQTWWETWAVQSFPTPCLLLQAATTTQLVLSCTWWPWRCSRDALKVRWITCSSSAGFDGKPTCCNNNFSQLLYKFRDSKWFRKLHLDSNSPVHFLTLRSKTTSVKHRWVVFYITGMKLGDFCVSEG